MGLILSISTRVKQFDRLLRIAEKNDNVFCTVGTHPHHAHEEQEVSADRLVELARHPKVVGIGEAGLDYHYDFSPRQAQEASFRIHAAAARESKLPLVIHSREAEDRTAEILEEEIASGFLSTLLHCYTSGPTLARRGLAVGAYVSFSGILTYKSAEELRAVAREISEDRVLVETDAPYLAPVPHRGKANEPAFVVKTLEKLAEIRGATPAAMAQATSDNFFRLFRKVPRPARYRRS